MYIPEPWETVRCGLSVVVPFLKAEAKPIPLVLEAEQDHDAKRCPNSMSNGYMKFCAMRLFPRGKTFYQVAFAH